MSRLIALGLTAALISSVASAQTETGTVTEYTGLFGDFIVSRDGVTYSLSTGEDLAFGDIVRATNEGEATITFDGCTYTLPAGQDITLNDQFCTEMAALQAPTEAELAAEELGTTTVADGTGAGTGTGTGTAAGGNAPLIIGGIVVAAGGIAAAAGGGGGDDGTPTPTSP